MTENPEVSQPTPRSKGKTVVTPNTRIDASARSVAIVQGSSLRTLVEWSQHNQNEEPERYHRDPSSDEERALRPISWFSDDKARTSEAASSHRIDDRSHAPARFWRPMLFGLLICRGAAEAREPPRPPSRPQEIAQGKARGRAVLREGGAHVEELRIAAQRKSWRLLDQKVKGRIGALEALGNSCNESAA